MFINILVALFVASALYFFISLVRVPKADRELAAQVEAFCKKALEETILFQHDADYYGTEIKLFFSRVRRMADDSLRDRLENELTTAYDHLCTIKA